MKYFGLRPFLLEPGVRTGLKIRYRNPLEVGSDRIAGAIAAAKLFPGQNAIIVDFGTATTIDALTEDRDYLGGVILPGLRLAMESLDARTARLPKVEIRKPPELLGRSTVESIQAGLYHGNIAILRHLCAEVRAQYFSGKPTILDRHRRIRPVVRGREDLRRTHSGTRSDRFTRSAASQQLTAVRPRAVCRPAGTPSLAPRNLSRSLGGPGGARPRAGGSGRGCARRAPGGTPSERISSGGERARVPDRREVRATATRPSVREFVRQAGHQHAERNQGDLLERSACVDAAVKSGDEVGNGDVEKARGRDREGVGKQLERLRQQEPGDDRPGHRASGSPQC